MREGGLTGEPGGAARLKRRMIERVLSRCESDALGELAPLNTLLRRFATEAAREEARLFCDELVSETIEEQGGGSGLSRLFGLLLDGNPELRKASGAAW